MANIIPFSFRGALFKRLRNMTLQTEETLLKFLCIPDLFLLLTQHLVQFFQTTMK